MFTDPRGPIKHFAWAKFSVVRSTSASAGEHELDLGKDIRLVGTKASAWEERKGHRLKREMVTGVYGQGIEVLVIGAGVYGSLKVPRKVREAIHEQGIGEVIVERTPEACRIYNELYHAGRRVALLAHGTC
ncbi:MAG: hypothetical protein FJZ90_17670 [Chloroflexi bacterium]|nr:hypothetical protein [Chloroflexota bacterium]